MRTVTTLLILLISVGLGFANNIVFPDFVVQYDFVQMGGTLDDGSSFLVAAKKRPFKGKDDPLSSIAFQSGDGDPPRFVMDHFEVAINEVTLSIPREAWVDLSDPSLPEGIRVNQGDDTIAIHVVGGDGAGSYHAILLIKSNNLVARKIDQHGIQIRIDEF